MLLFVKLSDDFSGSLAKVVELAYANKVIYPHFI